MSKYFLDRQFSPEQYADMNKNNNEESIMDGDYSEAHNLCEILENFFMDDIKGARDYTFCIIQSVLETWGIYEYFKFKFYTKSYGGQYFIDIDKNKIMTIRLPVFDKNRKRVSFNKHFNHIIDALMELYSRKVLHLNCIYTLPSYKDGYKQRRKDLINKIVNQDYEK